MNLIETYNGSGFYAQYADSALYDANGTPLTSYLTAVPIGTMNESEFEYSGGMITAYNGSAFKAGDEFPQSATEAIETVTANSADWNATTDTVSSNSGAWGGSALPISAGPGIKFEMVNDTLVASTDETVLWENVNGVAPGGTTKIGTLSEPLSNFKTYAIDVSFESVYPWKRNIFDVPNHWYSATNVPGVYFMGVTQSNSLKPQENNMLYDNFNTFGIGENMVDFYSLGSKVFGNGTIDTGITGLSYVYKVVGINRIAGGN